MPLHGSQCKEEAGAPLSVLRNSCTSVNEIPLIIALAITDLSAQEVADYPQQVERLEKHVTRRYVCDLSLVCSVGQNIFLLWLNRRWEENAIGRTSAKLRMTQSREFPQFHSPPIRDLNRKYFSIHFARQVIICVLLSTHINCTCTEVLFSKYFHAKCGRREDRTISSHQH